LSMKKESITVNISFRMQMRRVLCSKSSRN
jgi:hypothetical protein